MNIKQKREKILAALKYKNGSYYLGGMAHASIMRDLGRPYGEESAADAVNAATGQAVERAFENKGVQWALDMMTRCPPTPESDHGACLAALHEARDENTALKDKLEKVRGLPWHAVEKDEFSHAYVVMSCAARFGEVVYVDELQAALEGKADD